MNRTQSPDQQHESPDREVANGSKTRANESTSQGNTYLQQQIAEQTAEASSAGTETEHSLEIGETPWDSTSWVDSEHLDENAASTESRIDTGPQTLAAPGADAEISEERSAEALQDTEMELPAEAGLEEEGGHTTEEPSGGDTAPPSDPTNAAPPPGSPPPEGAPSGAAEPSSSAPTDGGGGAIDVRSIAGPAPTLAAAPSASGGGAVAQFVDLHAEKVAVFIGSAASMQSRILAATEASAVAIDAAIARGRNQVDQAIDAARNLAESDLQSAHAHVDAEAERALASIESSVAAAQESVVVAHAEANARLEASSSSQIARIESSYGSWQSRFDAIGPAVGDEATQLGATRAATWRGQKNGESSWLDGPIHDNKMEARAEAAENVASQYRQSLIESATERASAIQDGKARDLEGVSAMREASASVLQNQFDGSRAGLEGSREAAKARIEETRQNLHTAIDQRHGGRSTELSELQGARYAQLDTYGGAQRDAVVEAGAEAANTIAAEATQAGNAMMSALHEVDGATPAEEGPLSTESMAALDGAGEQFDTVLSDATTQLGESASTSTRGVTQSEGQIGSALSTLTDESASGVKTGGQGASQAFGDFRTSATDAYDQVLGAHRESLDQGLNTSKEGFSAVSEGIDGRFQEMNQALDQGFGEGAQGLEEGLRASLQDEDRDISKYAEEAAGRVQPRWKKVLKVVLVVAVIVAVCLVAGPLAAGLGAIGLSGLGAAVTAGTILGAAAGATIQMSHNLVDGEDIMQGVWKAAGTGAIGGAFGGLGAGLAAGVSSVAGRIGVEFGLDALGGVLGELAVGNAPTLEGILIGVGIGAGVGVGMRGVSAIRPKIRPEVSGPSSIQVDTPGVRVDTPGVRPEAPTPKTTEAPVTTARAEAPTAKTSTETPTPRTEPQTRTKKSVETQTVEFRTQVEAKYGPEGAEAFDRLAAVTRNPKQARDTLRYADALGMKDEVVAMIRSGKLDADSLRGLHKNVKAAESEVLKSIETGRYAELDETLQISGTRKEILEAASRTARGNEVSLGGRGAEGSGRPAGKADLIDYTTGEAIQMKVVTGKKVDAVIRNIDSATGQLGGKVKSKNAANAEIPPEGMQRIADIRIEDGNVLRGASRTETLNALQGKLSNLDNLDSTLTQHGHRVPPKQAGEVRIDTGHPDGPFRFRADELRSAEQALDSVTIRNQPEMPTEIPAFLRQRAAKTSGEATTPGQKVLETGREVVLPDGSTGRVRRVEGDEVHVYRNGQTEIHSRPEILQRMKVDSRQVDPQPEMDANYAGETTRYQPFDGPAFNPDGPSPRAVNQGSLGDCWFMAAMGATSRQQPVAVRKLVQNNGNGTYDVTLYIQDRSGSLIPSTKTVDMNFPSKDGMKPLYAKTGDQDEWWAALLEKRLAMETGSYEAIRGSNINKHMRFNGGSDLLTGQHSRYIRTGDQSNEKLLQTLKTAMDEGRPVTVGAHSESATDIAFNQAGKAEGVVFNHAYSLKAVDMESGTITLDNPWGPNVKDLVIDMDKFQKFFQSMNISTAGNSVTAPRTQPEVSGQPVSMPEAPISTAALPQGAVQTSTAAKASTPGAHGTGARRTPGKEAEEDFLGGRTTDEEARQIKELHGIDPDAEMDGLNTIPEEWLPSYVELIKLPGSGTVSRKFRKEMDGIWGVKSNSQDHAALAALRATENVRLQIGEGGIPTGKFAWDQYGKTPQEAMQSLERLSDVYRLMDNQAPKGNPTARARAELFVAMRDWVSTSEVHIGRYFDELENWKSMLSPGMDPSVAMLRYDRLGLPEPPVRIFQDMSIEDLAPWRQRIEGMGFDIERLRNPGVTGGRASREHWMDGKPVTAEETVSVNEEAGASDAMNIGEHIAALQGGEARSAREVIAAAEAGTIPRFVARVGKHPDSFSNRSSGDVYAADVADLRGLDGKPEEAMRMVGWEKSWIEQAKQKGSDVYVTVVDTQAAGWKTSEIDMSGIQQTAMKDIADPSSRFAQRAADAGYTADELPGLFAELDQLAPGAPRPEHLEPFAEILDRSYGLNSLYSGAGFTVTDEAIPGRTGNVGAREVKVSSDNLELDPAGRNVWWFSLKIGTLTPDVSP